MERDAAVRGAVPLLARATPLIGHFQIRNRGTVGGSLAHADPASEYPAVAVALDAELELAGPRGGRRRVAADDFFVGTWTTAARPDELLVAARFPVLAGASGFAVEEVARAARRLRARRCGVRGRARATAGHRVVRRRLARRCAPPTPRTRCSRARRVGRRGRGRGRRSRPTRRRARELGDAALRIAAPSRRTRGGRRAREELACCRLR